MQALYDRQGWTFSHGIRAYLLSFCSKVEMFFSLPYIIFRLLFTIRSANLHIFFIPRNYFCFLVKFLPLVKQKLIAKHQNSTYCKLSHKYNPQNETCDVLRTKRAKNKTKRFPGSKRSVPLTRFPEHPFFKKNSTRLRRDLTASRLSI